MRKCGIYLLLAVFLFNDLFRAAAFAAVAARPGPAPIAARVGTRTTTTQGSGAPVLRGAATISNQPAGENKETAGTGAKTPGQSAGSDKSTTGVGTVAGENTAAAGGNRGAMGETILPNGPLANETMGAKTEGPQANAARAATRANSSQGKTNPTQGMSVAPNGAPGMTPGQSAAGNATGTTATVADTGSAPNNSAVRAAVAATSGQSAGGNRGAAATGAGQTQGGAGSAAGVGVAAPTGTGTLPIKAGPKTTIARAGSTQQAFYPTKPKIAASMAADIMDNPCKEAYWGCMDMFCMSSNDSGGRCACSNESIGLDKEFNAVIAKTNAELAAMSALDNQIEFGGEISVKTGAAMGEISDMECDDPDDVACKVGAAKYNAASKLCEADVTPECKASFAFTKLQYTQNIRTDCAAYQTAIKDTSSKGAAAVAKARTAVRDNAAEQFSKQNKLDESSCSAELSKCMNAENVCGADWTRCVIGGVAEKRFHCESVLDQCQAVKEGVWENFVKNIAPVIRSAELTAENDRRMDCAGSISDCVVNACRDNIDGMGETMDACLARPEMVQSFCKMELACDANGNIWTYVKAKLAGMRVDVCTNEVKDCLESEDACGEGYGKCLGLDLYSVRKMCPLDKLVVCKENNPNFALTDVDNMITGIFLQIDNRQMADCQAAIYEKMNEICGSGVNCMKFTDDKMGAHSLRYVETGGIHAITGIINWGSFDVSDGAEWAACITRGDKDCSEFPKAGTLDLDAYIAGMRAHKRDAGSAIAPLAKDSDKSAETEIRAVAREIENVISIIESDQKIGWCLNGRDVGQITGNAGETTTARFPLMMQTNRRIIAEAALAKAVDNHNVEIQSLISKAGETADEKNAEYMCYSRPLAVSGRSVPEPGSAKKSGGYYDSVRIIGKSATPEEIASMAGRHTFVMDSILTRTVSAAYSRETRECKICFDDVFQGKRKYVEPRAGQSEDRKKVFEEYEKERKALGAVAMATGAVWGAGGGLIAVGTGVSILAAAFGTGGIGLGAAAASVSLAAVPVVGWIAIGLIGVAAIGVTLFSIFKGGPEDPMEQNISKVVDYCVTEVIGQNGETATPKEPEE